MKHGGLLGVAPTENGLYCAEVYFGWKLLEWRDGQWWHPDVAGLWPLDVDQWVGPLPKLIAKYSPKKKMEFDL